MPNTSDHFSFIHAADLHLDTPFVGVQATSPFVADALRDASLRAFERIVDLAIEAEATFVVFAGDIYDGPERGLRAQLRFHEGLCRLDREGIQSFIVHGNHDPLESGWSAIGSRLPARVTIFPPGRVEIVDVIRNGQRLATVQGTSFAERATVENLSLRFHRPDGPGIHIGLLHCNVEGSGTRHSNYSPCSVADLRSTELDYLALGHVHERRIVNAGDSVGEPWIVYPGNTQARSINETGAKGVYIVDVIDGAIASPRFVECDDIRFFQSEVPIDDCASVSDVVERVRRLGESVMNEIAFRSTIVRLTLTGRGPVHRALSVRDGLTELRGFLQDHQPFVDRFCHWQQVLDKTRPPLELEEIRQRGDFSADLLHVSSALRQDKASTEGLIDELRAMAPRAFLRELERLLEAPDCIPDLLEEAEYLALDAIEQSE